MAKKSDSFVHYVYFWIKKPVTREAKNKFENALKELVTIETITDQPGMQFYTANGLN